MNKNKTLLFSKKLVEETTEYIFNIFNGTIEEASKKQILLFAHYHIFIEHYQSIILLIESNKDGSALALLRPFIETFYRGLWFVSSAKDDQVEQYLNNNLDFGTVRIAKDLDKAYGTEKYFFDTKQKAWEVLSDYTHTGIFHINKRMKGNKIGAFYTEDNILTILEVLQSNLLLFSYLLLKEFNKYEEAESIKSKLQNRHPIKK